MAARIANDKEIEGAQTANEQCQAAYSRDEGGHRVGLKNDLDIVPKST